MSTFADIGQGSGLSTNSGARPLLAVITTGVMAHADAGINFTGTDLSWMESWVFLGILAVIYIAFWIMDRSGRSKLIRPGGRPTEAGLPYQLMCAAAGALLFAGSLASGGETTWPGLIAGAVLGFVGYLALGQLFMRANQRVFTAGDPGIVLGLGRDLLTVTVCVLCVLFDPLGYVVLVTALALLVTGRRGEGEKYEGLRILR